MTVTFYPGQLDGSTMRLVGSTGIEVSNRSAVIVMDALGIVSNPGGEMEIEKFLTIARAWLQAHINKPSVQIDSREYHGERGLTVIDLPLRSGYVNQRVLEIVKMLAGAKDYGATYVYWG